MILRERLIQLAEEIANLRAKLREKEAELDGLLPSEGLPLPIVASAEGTLVEQTLRFFATNPDAEIGPRALCPKLGLPSAQEKSLRATMGRLVADGRLRRVGRGRYAAKIEEQKETA
jgi:hypothetical protein